MRQGLEGAGGGNARFPDEVFDYRRVLYLKQGTCRILGRVSKTKIRRTSRGLGETEGGKKHLRNLCETRMILINVDYLGSSWWSYSEVESGSNIFNANHRLNPVRIDVDQFHAIMHLEILWIGTPWREADDGDVHVLQNRSPWLLKSLIAIRMLIEIINGET